MAAGTLTSTAVTIPIDRDHLDVDLTVPASPSGLVIFAHGSGSGLSNQRGGS